LNGTERFGGHGDSASRLGTPTGFVFLAYVHHMGLTGFVEMIKSIH
jgi:hypothetical protein